MSIRSGAGGASVSAGYQTPVARLGVHMSPAPDAKFPPSVAPSSRHGEPSWEYKRFIVGFEKTEPGHPEPEYLEELFLRAKSHEAVTWPGRLSEKFILMLLHRLFVLLATPVDMPYDGRLRKAWLDKDARYAREHNILEHSGLYKSLFLDAQRAEVVPVQFRDAFMFMYRDLNPVIAALFVAYAAEAPINDLTIDRKLFQMLEEKNLPLRSLHRAIFFALSDGSGTLVMKDLKTKRAWAVLNSEEGFAPNIPDTVSFNVDEWHALLDKHVEEWTLDAHKLWLSSLASLSGVTVKDVEEVPTQECFTMDCTVM